MKDIPYTKVIEGNLKAIKDTSDLNMWELHVMNVRGGWDKVQWMSHGNIQRLFKEELPFYTESKKVSYRRLKKSGL